MLFRLQSDSPMCRFAYDNKGVPNCLHVSVLRCSRGICGTITGWCAPVPKPRAKLEKYRKVAELKRRFTGNEISWDQYIKGLSGHI